MILTETVIAAYNRSIPRESGDDPGAGMRNFFREEYSPRERG